jgi:ferredoxin
LAPQIGGRLGLGALVHSRATLPIGARPETTPGIRLGSRQYSSVMRVHVDPDKCQGHNRCYALAPELFDVDDYGAAHEIGDGEVPAELTDKARLAVANCPEYAISIEE